MILPDVNPLVYAARREFEEHDAYADWLEGIGNGPEPFGLSETVLAGFLRVVTRRGPWGDATPLDEALAFVGALAERQNARLIRPGARHFAIFVGLVRQTRSTGKLVADAFHAALAIEHGCEWVTADGDFARFPGLRWSHPLGARPG
jgi:toxin-antitoxin system PIN domain toxin